MPRSSQVCIERTSGLGMAVGEAPGFWLVGEAIFLEGKEIGPWRIGIPIGTPPPAVRSILRGVERVDVNGTVVEAQDLYESQSFAGYYVAQS